jgi:voltage-gated potassium channel
MHLLTLARLLRHIRRHKAIGFKSVAAILAICLVGNAVCFYWFDGHLHDDLTFGDALWYSVISISTIGYGDYSASGSAARLGTFLFIVVGGLATFSLFLAMVIDWITELSVRERKGMSTIVAANHILIVNFPSATRVGHLITELQSDPQTDGREIVVITDDLETMPIAGENVLFVRGSVLEEETYRRARVDQARLAIVLATSYSSSTSDAVVASAVAVIDGLKPEIHIVAECLNPKHRMLFSSVRCDSIVSSLAISGNLLAQEMHDPGIAQMMDSITSNLRGTTLYSIEVSEPCDGLLFREMAVNLLRKDINLICVNRQQESFTSFGQLCPQPGDRAIYAAARRWTWPDLLQKGRA